MKTSRLILAAATLAVLATACAKKEEAPAPAAAPAAEAAAPAAATPAPAEAPAAVKDEDSSQSGGDKVRPAN